MLKKAITITAILLISLPYFGQEKQKAKYGFLLGINRTSLEHSLNNAISEKNKVGFRLGIMAEYHLVSGLYFTPRAELSFYNASLEYLEPNLFQRDYQVMPVGLEGKLNVAYKFREDTDLKPYIVAGGSYVHSLDRELESFEFPSGSTFTLDVGIGVERVFESFIFSPEFRYSHGLNNVNENPVFNGDVLMHNFTVALIFKG